MRPADPASRDDLAAAGRAPQPRTADRPRRGQRAQARRHSRRLWRRFPGDAAFEQFVTDGGDDLAPVRDVLRPGRASRNRLAKLAGRAPVAITGPRSPRSRDVMRTAVRFHAWLQWLIDRQLTAAGADDLMIADLAVGIDPDGADAWDGQDVLALGVRVGAPPDEFNTPGQDWGLPPFIPWRLRAAGYEPFIRDRSAPASATPAASGSTTSWACSACSGSRRARRPGRRGLRPLPGPRAARHRRAGERPGGRVRGRRGPRHRRGRRARRAGRRGVLSYRLMWFEDRGPEEYPRPGARRGDHPRPADRRRAVDRARTSAQQRLGLQPNARRTRRDAGPPPRRSPAASDDTPVDEVVVAAPPAPGRGAVDARHRHARRHGRPSSERPNMPGTIDEWPNWSHRPAPSRSTTCPSCTR